ncbi:MAG TPA: hypothetical protein PLY30_00365 [Candidatus Omnitrophota bacterium]|nr:hypothetical protein [Candidatus Omnitrophota bacterium]
MGKTIFPAMGISHEKHPLLFRSRRIFAAPVWPVAGTSGNAGVTIAKNKRHSNVPDSPLRLGYNRSAMLTTSNLKIHPQVLRQAPARAIQFWGSFGSSVGNSTGISAGGSGSCHPPPLPGPFHIGDSLWANNIDLPLAFAKDRQPDVVSVRRNQITRLLSPFDTANRSRIRRKIPHSDIGKFVDRIDPVTVKMIQGNLCPVHMHEDKGRALYLFGTWKPKTCRDSLDKRCFPASEIPFEAKNTSRFQGQRKPFRERDRFIGRRCNGRQFLHDLKMPESFPRQPPPHPDPLVI